MSEDIIEVHATIKGHVQGVGFRVTARQHAIRLGIIGTVRNLASGGVELFAQGKRHAVEEMLKVLSEFNETGKVSAIFSEEVVVPHHYHNFQIIF